MAIDYDLLPLSKGTSRAEAKRTKRLARAQQERLCRQTVNRRDGGRCVITGCRKPGRHKHHLQYRSKGGQFVTGNICSLCAGHHDLAHRGKIQIRGNADGRLVITGDTTL